MNRTSAISGLIIILLLITGTAGNVHALDLSGRCYSGQKPDESSELQGVQVTLYGAPSAQGTRTQLDAYTTGATQSNGWYGLTIVEGYEYYFIVAGSISGYSFQSASSVSGTVSGNEIHYSTASAPLSEQTLTGNKFWYTSNAPQNNPPAANDDSITTPQDTAIDIYVLSNDSDPDGDPLHINSATDPPHGTTVNNGTHVTYTPDSGFTGTDTFDYIAGDGKGGTDTATVTVTVEEGEEPPHNNPPIADAGGPYSAYVGSPVMLDGSGSYDPDIGDSITEYLWYWYYQGNYIPIGGVQTTPASWWIAPVVGQLTIKLEVTDSHGESDTDTATVDVQEGEPQGTGTLDGYKWDADTQEGLENWRIYIDFNGNGQWDEGEPFDMTDSTGYYQISGLEPGNYSACEEMQEGWEPEVGSSNCVDGIEIIEGTITSQDFHNQRTGGSETGTCTIRGMKYNDLNGNGQKDQNEQGLSGWTIYLDLNDNGWYDEGEPQTSTDENGGYEFTDLEADVYRIHEVNQSDWRQTDPTVDGDPVHWLINLEEGQEATEIDFGNFREDVPLEEEYDFGDAPDPTYPTLLVNNGARHIIDPDVYLGSGVDADLDGQPILNALGDDIDGNDDEDGVSMSNFNPGQTENIQVTASQSGILNAWIDYNLDGDWEEANEKIFSDLSINAGINDLSTLVPATAQAGATFARFRFSTTSGADITGEMPDGEVEDYSLEINQSSQFGNISIIKAMTPPNNSEVFNFTGDLGDFSFTSGSNKKDFMNLPAGSYTIYESIPPGWALGVYQITGDTDGGTTHDSSAARFTLDLDAGENISIVIYNYQLGKIIVEKQTIPDGASQTFTFTGDVDGVIGDEVQLYNANLEPGQYKVQEQAALGWTLTDIVLSDLNSTKDIQSRTAIFNVEAGETVKAVFINTKEGSEGAEIHGMKWNDLNGNMMKDAGEPGIANWQIILDYNQDGVLDPSPLSGDLITTTDASGYYSFTASMLGHYIVGEILQTGWQQTYPTTQAGGGMSNIGIYAHTINVTSGQVIQDVDFGNKYEGSEEGYDFGDAPDPAYPTLLASNGARHVIQPGYYLGFGVDSDPDGYTSSLSDGDDLNPSNSPDDEDGVTMSPFIAPGQNVPISIVASNTGVVNAWLDFNLDGDWADAGEHFIAAQPVSSGTNSFILTVPGNVSRGLTYARFRFSSIRQLSYDGLAPDGEVEDYAIEIVDSEDGSVVVIKEAIPTDDTPFLICQQMNSGFFNMYCTFLQDPTNNQLTILNPSQVNSISEATISGWTLQDITITGDLDNGSTLSLATGQVDLDHDPGENIIITFKNVKNTDGDKYDFGDAPSPYPTLLADNGAYHTIDNNYKFGAAVDAETDGQPDALSKGDDNHGVDDEEGYMTINGGSLLLNQAPITIQANGTLHLGFWFDFDRDGSWANNGGVFSIYNNSPFSTTIDVGMIVFNIPITQGVLHARVRIFGDSSYAKGPTGYGGPGEVEDYQFTYTQEETEYDYGDAPTPYPVTLLTGTIPDDGGRHPIVPGVYLGSTIDNEADGQPDANAQGDDTNNLNDEDGIQFTSKLIVGRSATINVTASTAGFINGYFDWNQDGDWDDLGERALNEIPVVAGVNSVNLAIPVGAKLGYTFARFRFSTSQLAVSIQNPNRHLAKDGEVEDYKIEVLADDPTIPPGGIIQGYKFNDLNNNGVWDGPFEPTGEPAIPNWTIWLDANQNGMEDVNDSYTQTNASGYFQFVGLTAGQYTVGEVQQVGWTQTTPAGGTHTVTVQLNTPSMSILFGNRQSGGPTYDGRICGSKWNDFNGDSIIDANEPYLANWKIFLDFNQNGQCDMGEPSQLTDASGSFEFTGLALGSYTVAEEMQTGWQQTWPGGAGTHTISVQSGLAQPACVLFGNQQTGAGMSLDWGDAPDPNYPTLRARNGAHHVITPGFFLGGSIDPDVDGQPTPDARGDDYDGSDDEDGVFFITPLMPSQQAEVEVFVSSAGYLDAWIDFDADGSWAQVQDQIFISEPVLTGSNVLTFHVPASIEIEIDTYVRFRFSSAGALTSDGPAQDGEVEDYHILLGPNGPYLPGEGEGHVPRVKWSQPPVEIDPNVDSPPIFCGWGETARTTQEVNEIRRWSMKLDDFHCLGFVPVTGLRWWGSYKAWTHTELPESQPEAWHIGFWANMVEDLESNELYPERLIWSLEIPAERVHLEPVGHVEFPEKRIDTCFIYELNLNPEEWFHQGEFESNEDIFWISITAIYPAGVDDKNLWNWITRPHIWGNGADSPAIMGEWPTYDERLFTGRIYPIENDLLCGQNQAFDLCFELLTEHPWIKWDQPFLGIREWPDYTDEVSMALETDEGEVLMLQQVVDDWFCERQDPVTAIVWNGSYIGYGYEACKCDEVRDLRKPDYFLLSIWSDSSGIDSESIYYPREKVWEYAAHDYDEILFGYDRNPEGEPNEPVFRYSVRLPEDEWFHQERPESFYWFSVVAVYQGTTDEIPYSWGWTNHSHIFGNPALSINYDSEITSQWQQLDLVGQPVDMSFTLLTTLEQQPLTGQIYYSKSTDEGITFEPGVMIDGNSAESSARLNPAIAEDELGVVHLVWQE